MMYEDWPAVMIFRAQHAAARFFFEGRYANGRLHLFFVKFQRDDNLYQLDVSLGIF